MNETAQILNAVAGLVSVIAWPAAFLFAFWIIKRKMRK